MIWREALAADLNRDGRSPTLGGALLAWFLSPAFQLLFLHRTALLVRHWPIVGRLASKTLWRCSVAVSGCYFSLDAVIGGGLALPHPVGIVIGEGVIIGDNATIYQHVTLGRAHRAEAAYPRIEAGATLYAGAVVVGNVRIGENATVAANAVVTKSVPDSATVGGVPAGPIRSRERLAGNEHEH